MSVIVGIDLGTSTTEAAVFRDGKPILLKNYDGVVITPSVVGIDKSGNWVVGERARAQMLLSPENTASEVKRLMGSLEGVNLGKRRYAPVMIQAKLLEYVRNYVSEALGEEVSRAVLSVPAYFDDIQRQETVLAGREAGFDVERILNEPTAAALSYGLEHIDEESHILVYDLGGGTFDVTLLEMFEGVLEVKASSGDNRLGGKDFDQILTDHLAGLFKKKHHVDLSGNPGAMARIRDEAVKCKIELSAHDSYRVLLPMLSEAGGKPLALEETISRKAFEKLTKDLIERTHGPIDTVIEDSGVSKYDIDKVILVGGSSRMPMVARDIEDYLGIRPEMAVNPDFAVAEGTAIQAAIISGDISPEEGLVITDVNPFTLGVKALSGFGELEIVPMIHRNTTIPVKRSHPFCTSYSGQTSVEIEAYQGESLIPENNHFLGRFMLDGVPPAPAGKETITVEFSYDLNGMLGVKATIDSNGKNAGVSINMTEAAKNRKTSRKKGAKKATALEKKYRLVLKRAERKLKDGTGSDELKVLADRLKAAINSDDDSAASALEIKILEMLSDG